MLSSSSPSLSVSLDCFYIFIFFQKAIHPLKFCIWRSARVTRIWNLSGVTFGSVSVPLSLEEEVSTMCRRGFWLYAASHSIPQNLLFFVYFTPFVLFFTILLHISRETVLFTQCLAANSFKTRRRTFEWTRDKLLFHSSFPWQGRCSLFI